MPRTRGALSTREMRRLRLARHENLERSDGSVAAANRVIANGVHDPYAAIAQFRAATGAKINLAG
jgi:hypothetical protein